MNCDPAEIDDTGEQKRASLAERCEAGSQMKGPNNFNDGLFPSQRLIWPILAGSKTSP